MNKWKIGVIAFLSGVVLIACDQTEETTNGETTEESEQENAVPEDLEENWGQYLLDAEEELESYAADIYLDVSAELGPGMLVDQSEDWISLQVIGDFSEKGYFVSEDEEGVTQELYIEDEDAYALENDEWVHYPGEGEDATFDASYLALVESIVGMEDLFETDVSGGQMMLSYEGNDQEAWDAFEQEFNLSIDGIEQEDLTIIIQAGVNEVTQFLEELVIDISGAQEIDENVNAGALSIYIETEFFEHNEVDLSEIQERVHEEANE